MQHSALDLDASIRMVNLEDICQVSKAWSDGDGDMFTDQPGLAFSDDFRAKMAQATSR